MQRQQEVEADKVKVAVICMALYRSRALYTLYIVLMGIVYTLLSVEN